MNSTKEVLKYIVYAGIVLILFTPFILQSSLFQSILSGETAVLSQIPFSLFFPYITGKAYFFRIIVEVIFLAWAALAIADKTYRPKTSFVLYSLVAFMVVIFFSNQLGVDKVASFWSNFERMEGYVTLLHLFALFIAAGSFLKTERDWKIIFNISIAASLFMAFIAMRQMGYTQTTDPLFRVDATLGNPIYLAVYMLFHIFFSIFYLLRSSFKKFSWWFYLLVILVDGWILFETGTRGAILALVGGLLLAGILVLISNRQNKVIRKFSLISLAVFIVVVGGTYAIRDSEFIKNSPVLSRATDITISSGTGEARLLNWQIAWSGFKERPILGWGQSNYTIVFDKYYLPAMHGNEPWFDRVHNIIFDWLIAGGIVGLLAYLSIFVSVLYLIWFKSQNLNNIDRSVITGLLAAYFFNNLFVFDQISSYLLFFLVLAYIHSQNQNTVAVFEKDLSMKAIQLGVIIAIALVPISVYGINNPSFQANQELIKALRVLTKDPVTKETVYFYPNGLEDNLALFNQAISRGTFANPEIRKHMMRGVEPVLRANGDNATSTKNLYISTSIIELENQIAETPLDSRFPYFLGTYYIFLGDYTNAEKWLLKAIELSPKKQTIRMPLIQAYNRSGQTEKAIALAKETYELDKSKDDLWGLYALSAAADSAVLKTIIDEAVAEGSTEKVVKFLQSNIDYQPENVKAYISLAAFYNQIGDATSSLAVLDGAIAKLPQYKTQLLKLKQEVVLTPVK